MGPPENGLCAKLAIAPESFHKPELAARQVDEKRRRNRRFRSGERQPLKVVDEERVMLTVDSACNQSVERATTYSTELSFTEMLLLPNLHL